MKETLLSILVCPECKSNFLLRKVTGVKGEIISGQLQCMNCGRPYPIIKGIPRILPENEIYDNYSRNFQYYWFKMDWQRPHYKQRFYQLTGWRPEDIKNKYVMDAGCGAGRWTYQFAEEGAREIVAFDYTLAVECASEICSRFKNIHYVQADIFKMPFKDNLFDIVHCHGVLMATPDPKKGTENLGSKVKAGREIVLLYYRNLTRPQRLIDEVACFMPKRLPTKLAYQLALIPTLIEYIPGAVPVFENIIHLSGQPDFTLKHLHNFDWYTCAYRHRNSPSEVSRWLRQMGFSRIKILDTNDFRIRSEWTKVQRFKEVLLKKGFFLKATLGVRATRKI